MNDPIVDEVRQAGEAYFARFKFDLNAICEDLQRSTEEAAKAGKTVVSSPPRTPQPPPLRSKKAS